MKSSAFAAIVLLAAVAGGCGDKKAPEGETSKARTEESATKSQEEKAPDVKGLKAKGNDPKVVDLAEKALKCEWKGTYFLYDCADLKAFKESELIKDGKADATLVAMVEDADEKVRFLGAQGLYSRGKTYRTDKQLAERLLNVMDGEKQKFLCSHLGSAVGHIQLKETGLRERIEKLITGHPMVECREATVRNALSRNPELYDFTTNIAKTDKEARVRKAAASAFWTGTPADKRETTCKLWLELVDDADPNVAGESAYLCGFYGQSSCINEYDELLNKIEKQAKEGTVVSSQTASALRYFYGQQKATDAQKKRALDIAKVMLAETKNKGIARGRALEFIGKEGGAEGKVLAAKYKDDKEFFVKSAAEAILNPKPADKPGEAPTAKPTAAPAEKPAEKPGAAPKLKPGTLNQ